MTVAVRHVQGVVVCVLILIQRLRIGEFGVKGRIISGGSGKVIQFIRATSELVRAGESSLRR